MEQDYFDESHYFICAGGFKPARFQTNQKQIAKRDDGNYYLTINSRKCHTFGDFSCRYAALLIAIIAALIAVLCSCPAGWVLLAAIAGAAVGAGIGMLICGDKAAIARKWNSIYVLTIIEGQETVTNQITAAHLTCEAFNYPITYAPNIKTELDAWFVFTVNVGFTGLEAFITVYAARGVTLLATQPRIFAYNFVVNYLKSISLSGIIARWGFSEIVGQQTYLTSQVEGGDPEEIARAKEEAFWFVEKPLSRIATMDYNYIDENGKRKFNTEQLINDFKVPLSLGGIPGGMTDKSGSGVRSRVGRATDATATDAMRAWDATFKPFIESAKAFREGLKGSEKGKGSVAKNSLSQEALKMLADMVEKAEKMTKKERPGAASILEKGNRRLARYSRKGFRPGVIPPDLHPLVKTWLENAPIELRNRITHGKCAEPTSVSDWIYEAEAARGMEKGTMTIEEARTEFEGVKSQAVTIDPANPAEHGQPKKACDTCDPLLGHFGIEEVGFENHHSHQ